ncbi:MAG: pilus assembly protein PilM [bacterium]
MFTKRIIGLDIADHTIEVVELVKTGPALKISGLARAKIAPGLVDRGRVKDQKELAKEIKKILSQAKPRPIKSKEVIFGLPDSQVYTHIVNYIKEPGDRKELSEDVIEDILKKEISTNIPLSEDDLAYSYQILYQDKKEIKILLMSANQKVLSEWDDFFKITDLKVKYFDIEALAVFRDLFANEPVNPICVVDIGSVTTNISIFHNLQLSHSHSISKAGDFITKKVAIALKIKPELAEQRKIKLDLGKGGKDKQAVVAVLKVLDRIISEVKKSLRYFKDKTGHDVEQIVLVGGTSQMKRMAEYFKQKLDLSVLIGQSRLLQKDIPLVYIEAVGLCLRELHKESHKKQPYFISNKKVVPDNLGNKKLKTEIKTISAIKDDHIDLGEDEPEETGRLINEDNQIGEVVEKKKAHAQFIALVVILCFGAIAIAGAFWYRSDERGKVQEEIKEKQVDFKFTQSFDIKIPLAINDSEYTPDRVKARIFENRIDSSGSINEARNYSKIFAEKQKQSSEYLWPQEISAVSEKTDSNFPLIFSWLLYSDKEVNNSLIKEFEKINKKNISFSVNNIVKFNLTTSTNPAIYYLWCKLTVAVNEHVDASGIEEIPAESIIVSDEKIELASTTSTSSLNVNNLETVTTSLQIVSSTLVIDEVIIKSTETGWLNARTGPSTNYDVAVKVYPGESYQLLQEKDGWSKIKLEDQKEAWVYSIYIEKK